MSRVNSPPHPSMSLSKSIKAVGKIFAADRRNPVDREVAARHIGYTGKSGASDKALAALAHFGLTEKVGKGSIRVSQLAMDILHPDPAASGGKERALLEAGMKPQLYKELRAQFPDHVSEGTLRSYLVRIGFNDTSLPPAMAAYSETLLFLEQSKAFESGGNGAQDDSESGEDLPEDDVVNDLPPPPAPIRPAPLAPPAIDEAAINKVNMNVQGNLVHLQATLDRKGIAALKRKLTNLEALLDDDDAEAHTGEA